MLFRKEELITLDVTSRFMNACVIVKKAESVFDIKARASYEHDGFGDCAWFDLAGAEKCAEQVLSEIKSRAKINKHARLFVGVPGEFTAIVNRELSIKLDRQRRIVDDDIEFLIDKGRFFDTEGYDIINASPVLFILDSSNRRYFDVRGMKATTITGLTSYMLASQRFTSIFTRAAANVGFSDVRFVSLPWAEVMTLFNRDQRAFPIMLVDVGYISSFAAIGNGEGLGALTSFSIGGGHIAGDIFEKYGVSFDSAERAKEVLDLNLSYYEHDILVADGKHTVYAQGAVEIAKAVLGEIASIISTVASKNEYPQSKTIYLTGEGILGLRGAETFLSERTGRNIEICAATLPGFTKPAESSEAALITLSDKLDKEIRDSGFIRTFQRR